MTIDEQTVNPDSDYEDDVQEYEQEPEPPVEASHVDILTQ